MGELSRRVSFPVYQDTTRSNIWGLLQGGKDSIFLYDRCGYQTYHIPYPESLLNRNNFQTALWNTYFANPCDCGSTHPSLQSPGSQSQRGNQQTRHHGHQQGSTGNHGHHQHHRRTRRQRNQGHQDIGDVVLHRDRWSEIMSNSISKCRFDDTLCYIMYSNNIRFRHRYRCTVKNIIRDICANNTYAGKSCFCPVYADTGNCTCSVATAAFSNRRGVDRHMEAAYCACGVDQTVDTEACVCKSCDQFRTDLTTS